MLSVLPTLKGSGCACCDGGHDAGLGSLLHFGESFDFAQVEWDTVSIPPPLDPFFKENKIFILSISEKLKILIKRQMHCWSS